MPQRLVAITFSLDGYIREDKTNSFVSYCAALDLYSAGKTRIDACGRYSVTRRISLWRV